MKKIKRFDLVIFLAIVSLANGLSAPILSLYLESIGVSTSLLGLMFSVQMAALAIGEVSLGFLSDRIGHKTVMYASPLFAVGTYGLLVFSQEIPLLFLSFFLGGLGIASSAIAGRVYGATIGTREEKPYYMAIVQTTFRVSHAAGSLAGGFISSASGYLRVFQTSLGILILPLLIIVADLRKKNGFSKKPVQETESIPVVEHRPIGGRWRMPSAAVQALAAMLIFIGHGILQAFLPLLAADVAGASNEQVGIMFAAMNILNAVFTFPAASVSRRIGKENAMTLGLFISGVSLAGMALLPTFGWIMAFVVVNSFARPLFTIPGLALISDTLSIRRQGAGMGLYGLSEDVGLMIGSGLGGYLWSDFGYRTTYLMGSAAAALGVLVCIVLIKVIMPRLQKEAALTPEGATVLI